MGRRCGWSDGSGGSGKATEGARFVAAARKYLRLGEVEPSSVNKRRKRKRKSGDITVQI